MAVIAASALFTEFESDEATANEKYLNKTVQIKGIVEEVTETTEGGMTAVIKGEGDMFGVQCSFLEIEELKPGAEVSIRGKCTGYLMDVNLARCVVVQ